LILKLRIGWGGIRVSKILGTSIEGISCFFRKDLAVMISNFRYWLDTPPEYT
jgi:hypothetical protein